MGPGIYKYSTQRAESYDTIYRGYLRASISLLCGHLIPTGLGPSWEQQGVQCVCPKVATTHSHTCGISQQMHILSAFCKVNVWSLRLSRALRVDAHKHTHTHTHTHKQRERERKRERERELPAPPLVSTGCHHPLACGHIIHPCLFCHIVTSSASHSSHGLKSQQQWSGSQLQSICFTRLQWVRPCLPINNTHRHLHVKMSTHHSERDNRIFTNSSPSTKPEQYPWLSRLLLVSWTAINFAN